MNYYYMLNNGFKLPHLSGILRDVLEEGDRILLHFPQNDEEAILQGKKVFFPGGKSPYYKDGVVLKGEGTVAQVNWILDKFYSGETRSPEEGLRHMEVFRGEVKLMGWENFRVFTLFADFYEKDDREAMGLSLYDPFIL